MAKDNKQDHFVIMSEQKQEQEHCKPQKWSHIPFPTQCEWLLLLYYCFTSALFFHLMHQYNNPDIAFTVLKHPSQSKATLLEYSPSHWTQARILHETSTCTLLLRGQPHNSPQNISCTSKSHFVWVCPWWSLAGGHRHGSQHNLKLCRHWLFTYL